MEFKTNRRILREKKELPLIAFVIDRVDIQETLTTPMEK